MGSTSKGNSKLLQLFIALVLIMGALFPPAAIASAQDEVPPATEETVTETEEIPVEEAGEGDAPAEEAPAESAPETGAPVEEPAAPTEEAPAESSLEAGAPVEELAAPAETSDEAVEMPAAPEEPSGEAEEEPAPVESLPEVLDAMVESDAVLVDAEGEEIPLASQEAVEVLSGAKDPWFTANDGSGKVIGYTSIGGTCDSSVLAEDCHQVDNPIQAAIADDLSTGQVVKILAGSYDEEVTINKAITFEGVADGGFVDAIIRSIILNTDISGWTNVFGHQVLVKSGAHIQDGIDIVQAGGTVNVAPGDYEEEAVDRTVNGAGNYQFGLYVGKDKNGITVQGVKADGTPVGNYGEAVALIKTKATNSFGRSGIMVEGDNVTFKGLMIGDNYDPDGALDNNKTFEILGDGFTLIDNQLVVSEGASVYFGDWSYDEVNNISTINNFTVENNLFAYGASLDISNGVGNNNPMSNRRVVNNVFEGNNVPWALVSFNGIIPDIGWFVNSVGGALITGNSFSNAPMYIRSRGTVDDASFDWESYWDNNTFDHAAVALQDLDTFDVRESSYISYAYTSSGDTFDNVRLIGSSIQDQIDIAQDGDTILASAGTFVEQLQIINKNISLLGYNSIIQSPSTLLQLGVPPAAGKPGLKPVVYVNGGTDVIIDGFTIDGANKGSANNNFVGVEFYNAGGTLQNSKIINVMNTTFSGAQHGVGLYVWNDAGVNTTLNVLNNQIYDFQKNATAFFGSGLVLDIENNTITGAGLTGVTAQNGIQITDATGLIKNNTITGMNYDKPDAWVASAMLLYNSPDLQVIDNTITDSNVGIFNYQTNNATISGNTINNNLYGLYAYGSPVTNIIRNIISGNDYGLTSDLSPDMVVNENTMTDNAYAYLNYGSDATSMSENVIENNEYGLEFVGNSSGTVVNFNKIVNNNTQMEYDGETMINAHDNWWGDNTGLQNLDDAGMVDASTWLKLGLDAAPNLIYSDETAALTSKMYSSDDDSQSAIDGLWWFDTAEITNANENGLGDVLANIFNPFGPAGRATFSSEYSGKTFNGLAFIDILAASGPGQDGGDGDVVPLAGGLFVPGNLPVIPVTGGVIPVTGGMNALSCTEANTLMLASGNSVAFSAPLCGFEAGLNEEAGGSLPAPLPAGYTFAAGMTVSLQKSATPFPGLPEPVTSTLNFKVPDDLAGKTLVILFWDAAANGGLGAWVEVPSSAPGQATVNYTGTFVLAYK